MKDNRNLKNTNVDGESDGKSDGEWDAAWECILDCVQEENFKICLQLPTHSSVPFKLISPEFSKHKRVVV